MSKDGKELIKDKILELEEEYEFYHNEGNSEKASYVFTDLCVYKKVLQDLEELDSLHQAYNELSEQNEILNQSINDSEMSEERDLFKLAFYSLWKCCNSRYSLSDVENSDYYIEFKVGYESVCVGLSLEEIESIEKACKLLDMQYCEVEDEETNSIIE